MTQGIRASAELHRRNTDGLAMLRLLPTQFEAARNPASELLIRGGNRSGKSLTAAAMFASFVRDMPIKCTDGREVHIRPQNKRGAETLCWVIGLKWDHIGTTIWRLLFKPGLYKIIRDIRTNRWRAFDPERDADREHETKPSFPLIPISEIQGGSLESIHWEDRKGRQFSMIPMKNGTVISAYASTGEVKEGDPVDYIWIDERITFSEHYAEYQARLSDKKGRIVWSVKPNNRNMAMRDVTSRAKEQAAEISNKERKTADVAEYVLKFSANPFIDEEEKRKRREGWSEADRKMRDEGEYPTGELEVYPSFDPDFHCAIYPHGMPQDALSKLLRETKGIPPKDWTRELILDPGTAKPAVLFGAIPPREFWHEDQPTLVAYDEIYIPRLDAEKLADEILKKSSGLFFQRFIIDGNAARQTPMGFKGTVGGNYTRAFRQRNLSSIQTGTGFLYGDPTFDVPHQMVNDLLAYRKCGFPRLRIVTHRCPNLCHQMQFNLKQTQRGPNGEQVVIDKPANGQKDDLRRCMEYWVSLEPTYVEPPLHAAGDGGPGMRAYKKIMEMFPQDDKEPDVIKMGPGTAA